jgi:hypothetical protein
MWTIIFLYAICVVGLWWLNCTYEGFAYKKNPCAEFKNCGACANAAGCGWCSDLNVCQPMAQDGFPIRTLDSSTDEDVTESPYLDDPRTEADIRKTAPASRIHICNPMGFITVADMCQFDSDE